MSSPENPIGKKPWSHEPMVWLVIAIPALAVVVGLLMLAFSISSYDGLVVDDYYKQGVTINRRLERQSRATRLDLRADVKLQHQNKRVEIQLTGNPDLVYPDQITMGLYHATRAGLDREETLTRAGDQHYIGNFDDLSPGRWHIVLQTDEWKISGSVFWPDDGKVIAVTY